MFAKTQNTVSMILGVALSAAAAFAAPVFAGEAALAHNEGAAQSAIVGTGESASASVDTTPATLARNENLAQRVIVDESAPTSDRMGAIGEATLTQNELAAQRAIADAAVAGSTQYATGATTSVVSTRSPAQH